MLQGALFSSPNMSSDRLSDAKWTMGQIQVNDSD
jgi:hypothetical protein